jgi:hypothetical protein
MKGRNPIQAFQQNESTRKFHTPQQQQMAAAAHEGREERCAENCINLNGTKKKLPSVPLCLFSLTHICGNMKQRRRQCCVCASLSHHRAATTLYVRLRKDDNSLYLCYHLSFTHTHTPFNLSQTRESENIKDREQQKDTQRERARKKDQSESIIEKPTIIISIA